MNLRATHLELSPPQVPATRFLYPGGARPLEGYTIKRGVGHGGFGEVYYAVSDAGKEVAIKLIRRNLDIELRGVTQCLNLKHPNLLSIYDIRQGENGETWVIMEYVQGDCLDDVIARHPNGMPLDQVLHWFAGMAAGVAYLHDHGVVHRDLKPGNIFYDEGVVKIGDYGLSKFISCSRRSGQTGSVGTVHYMAPEVANGRYGKEIDIYALGVILYEMLTGHVPFEGESIGEVLMKHLTAEPDVSRLAEPYRTIVARALAKAPEVRFHTVADMLAIMPGQHAPTPHYSQSHYPYRAQVADQHRPEPAEHGMADKGGVVGVDPNFLENEPVARGVRTAIAQVKHVYRNATDPGTAPRIILNVVLIVMAVMTVHIWASLLAVGCFAYVVYIGVRAIVFSFKQKGQARPWRFSCAGHKPRHTPPVAVNRPVVPPQVVPIHAESPPMAATLPAESRTSQWRPRGKTKPTVPVGTPRERATELVGSMIVSGIVALVASLLMAAISRGQLDANQFAWLASSGIIGAWAILIPGKLFEGQEGDPIVRRFVFLVLGLGVGAASFGLSEVLLAHLPNNVDWELDRPIRSFGQFYDNQGAPLLMAFMTYFGFLYLVPRWWRQTDPLRRVRLSLFFTAVVGFWAWLLHQFWPFPQPWGVMVALTISIAVQFSSRWIAPRDRGSKPATN